MNGTKTLSSAERLALGLGWFSVGLGLMELAAPGAIARLIGAPPEGRARTALRAIGMRELTTGISILANPHRAGPLWGRVAGDALDLALLGSTYGSTGAGRARTAAATLAVAGSAVIDALCALQLNQQQSEDWPAHRAGAHVEHVATIARPIGEVYQFWRRFEDFPRFMRHLESVTAVDSRRSHWRARGPLGMIFEWDAEIVSEREPEVLAWRSLPGSRVQHHGSVQLSHAPGARGTELRVVLEYLPPAGEPGRFVAKLLGQEPEQQLREDLRRFKQLLETGEVASSDGPGMRRPARPASQPAAGPTLEGVAR